MTTAPARLTVSNITDNALDQLYAERDQLRIEVDRLYVTANLRACLWPGCLRQYDALSWASGESPARPEWSGRGWRIITRGLLPGGDRVCPDHADLVTAHRHQHSRDHHGLLAVTCACGRWSTSGHRWHRVPRALWEQHLLTVAEATEPGCPAAHAARPHERPGAVGAVPGMPETPSGPQTGAQPLTPDAIADLLDEFIADAKQRGADPAWLRGARCITGRLRLADPDALGGDQPDDGLRDRIAATLAAAGGTYTNTDADHLADAVMPVVERWAQQLAAGRATWKAKAEEIERDRDRLAARIETLTHVARSNKRHVAIATDEAERHEALLRDAERYLSALHTHAGRHEILGADFTCAGCQLADRIRQHLDGDPTTAEDAAHDEAMRALERGEDHL